MSVLVPVGCLGVAVAAALVLPRPGGVVVAAALGVIALACALFGRVRVLVGRDGLTAGLGWFGWPRLRVPLEQVADVAVERVEPMRSGGWGLRLVAGTTAVVIRRGEGIRMTRTTGRTLVVTVDGAAQGAAVLLAYRQEGHRA
jgi:hypothetical protein